MSTALFIHAHPGVEDVLVRHWHYYQRSGCELFGVGRIDKPVRWPYAIVTRDIGTSGKDNSCNLPLRLVDTLAWFMEAPRFAAFDRACIIEYDSVFLAPLPNVGENFAATRAGGPIAGFQARFFVHCPWVFPRWRVPDFIKAAHKLIAHGECEKGSPDFFISLVCERNNWTIDHLPGVYSRNTIESPADIEACRAGCQSGKIWFIHGIKTEHQFRSILL